MRLNARGAFLLLLSSVGSASAVALPPRQEADQCMAQNATSYAFIYGIPLLAYETAWTKRPQTSISNIIFNAPRVASPEDHSIVKPNVDTLYGGTAYDVSSDDVEINIGEVDADRYWVTSFYTPFGENYLNLGALSDTPAGKYLLTPANSTDTAATMQPSTDPAYASVIYTPTTLGYMLVRILLKNTTTDVAVVKDIQKGFSSSAVPRDGDPIGPALNADLFADNSTSQPDHLLNLMSRFSGIVPPALASTTGYSSTLAPEQSQSSLQSNLSLAGFSPTSSASELSAEMYPYTYTKPACVNTTAAFSMAGATVMAYGTSPNWLEVLGHGWLIPPDSAIGLYHGDYMARSAVAQWAYLAMTSDQALYPKYLQRLELASNESYTLTFVGGKPQITDLGFWSVTMYNSSGFLVENSINRYSLGDRSNLTYPDGRLVYNGTTADKGREEGEGDAEEFQILIQKDTPPSEWVSNWLPSPEGGFDTLLRFYAPEQILIDGNYTYPTLVKGAAKTVQTSAESKGGKSSSSSTDDSDTGAGAGLIGMRPSTGATVVVALAVISVSMLLL